MHATEDLTNAGSLSAAGRRELDQIPRILRRRSWAIISCIVIVAGAAFGLSRLQQTKYAATSALYFATNNLDSTYLGGTVLPPSADPTREAATNLSLVELPSVATQTATALRVPRSRVAADISAASAGHSDIVDVTATDHDPVFAAKLASAYADQFVIFRRDSDRAKVATARQLVNAQLAQLTPAERSSAQGRSLQSQAERLSIVASLQTGNAEVVQRAGVPTAPSSPRTPRNVELGLVVGLLLGIAAAFLLDRVDQRMRTPDELEAVFGLPVLAAIPESPDLGSRQTGKAMEPAAAESFRLLRARLRYFNIDQAIRTLVITSVAPGEGKTTVAEYLAEAAATAVSGNRVLLLEADLRRPRLGREFGLNTFPGLAEVLTHDAPLAEVVQRVNRTDGAGNNSVGSFDVIVAGANPPNHAELLESERMGALLEFLAERYDMVVIDTPPSGVVSDGIPLMSHADGVIIVSAIGQSTRTGAEHLRAQLARLEAPVLGVVANRVKTGRGRTGYYNSYYDDASADRSRPSVRRGSANGGARPLSRTATSGP